MVAFSYHLKAVVVQCSKLLFQDDQREFVCGVDWLLTCPLAAVGHSEKCNQEVFRLLLGDLPCPSPLKVLRNATSLFRPFYKALLPRRCPKSSRKCSWLVETCRLQASFCPSISTFAFPGLSPWTFPSCQLHYFLRPFSNECRLAFSANSLNQQCGRPCRISFCN